MKELYEQQKLESITIRGGENAEWYTTVKNEFFPQYVVESITVTYEDGPLSMHPWAKVELITGKVMLVNLSLCEEIGLLP